MDDTGHAASAFSSSRIEALTDGVFAIAMTLLVIELKLPEPHSLQSSQQLAQALADLFPKGIAWVISFGVIALFWMGHLRVFHDVHRADGTLITLNLLELAVVTLMPFTCALIGEFPTSLVSQVMYSINMFLLGITALLMARHIYHHPRLSSQPMPKPTYEAARLRIGGVIAISILATLIGALFTIPIVGNMAFMLMAVINPLSRRMERRRMAALRPGPAAAAPGGSRPTRPSRTPFN